MRFFFLLFLLLSSSFGFTQNKYPIKLDHRWGFIDETGRIITRPKYDRIGKELSYKNLRRGRRSNAFTVELDGKLGLIGRTGKELLEPKYYGIELINDSTFLVLETPDATIPVMVNTQGNPLVRGDFSEAFPIKKSYYRVAQNGLWGVQYNGDTLTIPVKFPWLKPHVQGRGYVSFKTAIRKEEKGLMDLDGNLILPDEFVQVQVLNDSFFICIRQINKKQKRVEFWNGKVAVPLDTGFVDAQIMGPELILLSDNNQKVTVYSATQRKILAPVGHYDRFRKILGTDYLSIRKNGQVGLMDKKGKVLVPPQFNNVRPLTPELFEVTKRMWVGIFNTQKGITLPIEFEKIEAFEEGFAQVGKNDKWGLVNSEGKLIIEPEYQLLIKAGNLVKAYKQLNDFSKNFATPDTFTPEMDTYQLNEAGEVEGKEIFQNVYTLRVGYQVNITDYPDGVPNTGGFGLPSNTFNNNNFDQSQQKTDPKHQINSIYEWYFDEELKLWGLQHRHNKTPIFPPTYTDIKYLPFTDLTLVTSPNHRIIGEMDTLLQNFQDSIGLSGQALFSHFKGDFITPFEMTGLRVSDFRNDHPLGVFINKKGQFHLINQKGEVLNEADGQPLAFDYVGKFNHGIAPVAINGNYVKECESDSCMTPLLNQDLIKDFYVHVSKYNVNGENGFNINFAKWGYIDTLGQWYIPPKYEYTSDIKDSLAVCKKGDFWGMMDMQEKPVLDFEYASIKPYRRDKYQLIKHNDQPVFYNQEGQVILGKKYDKFGNFSEGLCWVRKDSLWGFIDINGEEIIECQYQKASDFGQGRAAVRQNGQWFFIDKNNKKVRDAPDDVLFFRKYSHNKIAYKASNGKYGYLDWQGKTAIPPVYSVAFDYHRGLARAAYNKKTGLLDTLGNYVMKPQLYDLVFDFNEYGLAHAYERNDEPFGLINRKGDEIAGMKYKVIEPFKDGYAKVLGAQGYGLINTEGEEVIPAEYESIGDFSEEVIAVRPYNSNYWMYMTLEHQPFLEEEFTVANAFVEGRTIVTRFKEGNTHYLMIDKEGNEIKDFGTSRQVMHQSEGLIGMRVGDGEDSSKEYCYFVDTDGEKVFNRNFADIEAFQNGRALVKNKKSRWGLINTYGHDVIMDKYQQLEQKEDDIILAYSKRLIGLCDLKGNMILEPEFDVIYPFGQLIRVEREDGIGYLDRDGNWVWEVMR